MGRIYRGNNGILTRVKGEPMTNINKNLEEKCKICNSGLKTSKLGNIYCSNFCWKKKEYNDAIEAEELENIKYECIHGLGR